MVVLPTTSLTLVVVIIVSSNHDQPTNIKSSGPPPTFSSQFLLLFKLFYNFILPKKDSGYFSYLELSCLWTWMFRVYSLLVWKDGLDHFMKEDEQEQNFISLFPIYYTVAMAAPMFLVFVPYISLVYKMNLILEN